MFYSSSVTKTILFVDFVSMIPLFYTNLNLKSRVPLLHTRPYLQIYLEELKIMSNKEITCLVRESQLASCCTIVFS